MTTPPLDWAAWSKLRTVESLARAAGQTFIADLIHECVEAFVGGGAVPPHPERAEQEPAA
jgi:hypothetical protein